MTGIDNHMSSKTTVTLTADIASAFVSNNSVSMADVPALISKVYAALEGVGKPTTKAVEELKPAVSIRSSVKPDAITCLDCGKKFKMLKRHLNVDHGMTPEAYRARWGLAKVYPVVAPDYAATRRGLAMKIGLGRKAEPVPAKPVKAARKPRAKKVPAPEHVAALATEQAPDG